MLRQKDSSAQVDQQIKCRLQQHAATCRKQKGWVGVAPTSIYGSCRRSNVKNGLVESEPFTAKRTYGHPNRTKIWTQVIEVDLVVPHRIRDMTYEFVGQQRHAMRTNHAFKKPQRITITLPYATYEQLVQRSDQEGRSLSNLAAFLLESSQGGKLSDGGSRS